MNQVNLSMVYSWFLAIRPKTLVASIIPVTLAGSEFFPRAESFPWIVLVGCFAFSILVQIGCNLANDYYDFLRGSDFNRKMAPDRMVVNGKIKPQTMRFAFIFIFLLSFIVGWMTWYKSGAHMGMILVGVLSILFALAYTGGPFPLAYNGLGDLFVIIFFGFVALEGTTFVLSSSESLDYDSNFILSLGTGLIINNLLVINNFRDVESDRLANKRTIIVLFGRKIGVFLFILSFGYVSLILPIFFNFSYLNLFVFVPSILSLVVMLKAEQKKHFDWALVLSSFAILLFAWVNVIGYDH